MMLFCITFYIRPARRLIYKVDVLKEKNNEMTVELIFIRLINTFTYVCTYRYETIYPNIVSYLLMKDYLKF